MRRIYGSSPAHLLGHLALFALAAYALDGIFFLDTAPRVLIWLGAAVLFHDAVLWPLYSAADTLGRRVLGDAVNYARVPAGLSLLLGLAFFAVVSGKGGPTYAHVSGAQWHGYLARWLVVSAALFAVSALAYAARRR